MLFLYEKGVDVYKFYLLSKYHNYGITLKQNVVSLTHTSLASHFWDMGNSADPDQMPQNAASDLGLHRLLTGISIRNRIKMQKYTRHS